MNKPTRLIANLFLGCAAIWLCAGCQTVRESKLPTKLPTNLLPDQVVSAPANMFDRIDQTFKGPEPNREIALASFRQAEQTFESAAKLASEQNGAATADFRKAVAPYKTAAKHAPGTTIEEDAMMMVAESHFFADQYDAAANAYDELIEKYPRTRHLDRIDQRRFAISQYWLNTTKTSKWTWVPNFFDKRRPNTDPFGYATKNFDKIRFDNPTGKLADDATMAAAIANFEKEKWGQADVLFSDIRENFPSSEHQFQAHFLGLKCKQNMYRGPDYASNMLDDSEKIIRKIYRLFPQQAAKHNEELQAVHKDVRLKQATRDYSMARYYDSRGEYGSARLYYDKVKSGYGDTNLALESEDRLSSISEYPAKPREPLGWMANMFPKSDQRVKPLLQRGSTQ